MSTTRVQSRAAGVPSAWCRLRGKLALLLLLGCALGVVVSGAKAMAASPSAEAADGAGTGVAREVISSLGKLASLAAGRPVLLRATVTYSHPQWGQLYVQTGAEGMYVSVKPGATEYKPGDVVEIIGETIKQEGGNLGLKVDRVHALAQREVLVPESKSIPELLRGMAATRWVNVEGKVLAAYGRDRRLVIRIADGTTNIPIIVLHGKLEIARRWQNGTIRANGVCSLQYDTNGRQIGAVVLANDLEQVQLQQAAGVQPLERPIVPIDRVRAPSSAGTGGFAHIHGQLERFESEQVVRISDRSSSIRVACLFRPEAQLGDNVEVLGVPELRGHELTLRDGVVMPIPMVVRTERPEPEIPPGTNGALPLLKSAREVHRLSRNEARRGYPVQLSGVVTFVDTQWSQLYLQDDSDAVFVSVLRDQPAVRPGQRVVLTGVTATGGYAPIVARGSLKIQAEAEWPFPTWVTLTDLLTGQYDCRWVEMAAVALSTTEEGGRVTLHVRTRQGRVSCVLGSDVSIEQARRLLGARLAIRGAVSSKLNPVGKLVTVRLQVPSIGSIRVLEEAPADPFRTQTTCIADLPNYQASEDADPRVKISGQVTGIRLDGVICLQDDSGGMFVSLADGQESPHVGANVEVLGYFHSGELAFSLVDARLKFLGWGALREPVPVTANEILAGEHLAELVQMEAQLLDDAALHPGAVLSLQSGPVAFEARAAAQLRARSTEFVFPAGARLKVTGVCQAQVGLDGQVQSFRLVLRDSQDVQVLSRPTWWTFRRLGAAVMGLSLIGAIAFVVSFILARKNRALREGEERLRAILDHVPVGITVIDKATRTIMAANPIALSILARTSDQVVGRPCVPLLCGAVDACGMCNHGETVEQTEWSIQRPDGSLVPVLKKAVPVSIGGSIRIIECLVDITDRKRAQEELLVAKDAAEAASRAKSEFLAMMSHEIRTPLSGVIGVLRLMSQDGLSARQRRHIEMAGTSAETLLKVINDILDFSKVEAGKLDLDVVTFDLPRTVESIAAVFQPRASAKRLQLQVMVEPSVPTWVKGDPLRAGQVLMNLLGNAIKFTEAGAVRVHLESRPTESDRVLVRCSVTDTGIGIPPVQQQYVFEPFRQVDSSTRRRFGGTGLGLGICHRLVDLMGGTMGFTSEAGKGSVFWFDLPFGKATNPEATGAGGGRASEPAPAAHDQPWQAEHPVRVLLAEDHEINQELAREMIEAAGCRCECVSNGRSAVSAVLTGSYDLVFMDCMMPEMDGYEATEAIRAAEGQRQESGGGRRIPIIAMTANAMKGDREACLSAGMDDYLSKPLDPQLVKEKIRQWIQSLAAIVGMRRGLAEEEKAP